MPDTDIDDEEVPEEVPEEAQDMTDAETALAQVQQMHQQIDTIKQLAVNSATELETKADNYDLLEETLEDDEDMLREASRQLRNVYQRIEQGDSNVSKMMPGNEDSTQ